jgi:hypothetical protein
MIKQLTIKKNIALEAVKNCSTNEDLELVGVQSLKDYSEQLKYAIEAGSITDETNFKDTFGYNNNFFYVLEVVNNETVEGYERGVGYIYEQDNRIFLKRVAPLYEGKNSSECYPCKDLNGKTFCSSDNVLLYSSAPTTYLEALVVESCVITSSDPCVPNPVHLPNNSMLVRFDDNIEGVTFSDKRLVDKVVDIFSKFSKQLKLATSKLSVKRAEADTIDLVPLSSENVKAKVGSFCYDKTTNTVKVYTANGWRTLQFEQL